jgi:uncharacterized membrane protein HdeD (DUF308 family)
MGLASIGLAIALLAVPGGGYVYVILLIGFGLLASGIGTLFYYFTMTRFMVGGKLTLYKGVILTDFAILTLSLADVPKMYIVLYLSALHGFTGLVEILRALEARRWGGRSFRLKLAHGILNVTICVACIVLIKKSNIAVLLYAVGLFYSGIMTVISAFRRGTLVFVR